jgi:isopentenyl diphosphate isomerase/L-lactate dehydrogenase-like FMN-dependent dehydrogenase
MLEAAAEKVMSARAFAYVAGGAGSETTQRANRAAFERRRIVPRVLTDVSSRDLSTELLGRSLRVPLLLAPVGVLEMAHRDADLAVARAAAETGVPMVFSSQASVAMEQCAAGMGAAPRWFQLYWSPLKGLMESFVARAEASGCDAIMLTLDTRSLGWRPRDLDLGSLPFLSGMGIAQYTSDPVFRATLREPMIAASPAAPVTMRSLLSLLGAARRHPDGALRSLRSGAARRTIAHWAASFPHPALVWADLPRLRAATRLPIVLKGILHPDDARRAVDEGADAVVVSNHGGRQVDASIASLDALPGVVGAVGGRVPVLFDSGVRTGADAFIALALGAKAVLVGRPYVYGLALAGERGVREVIENLIAELDLTMALAGARTVAELPGRVETVG